MKWNEGTPKYSYYPEWVDTDFECPDCGGIMQKHQNVVLASYPPKYEYKCKKCGKIRYRYQ